jgi:hypothetical protein
MDIYQEGQEVEYLSRGGKTIGGSEIASLVVGSNMFTVCYVCLVFQLWLSLVCFVSLSRAW